MIEEKVHEGWYAFKNFVKELGHADKEYWFRGQHNPEWVITPTYLRAGLKHLKETNGELISPVTGKKIGGIKLPDSKQHIEKLQKGLNMFKKFAKNGTDKYNEYDDNDWWALARHHKLHTPMIDWTMNPLIAYYFALIGFHGESNFNDIDDFYIGGSNSGRNGKIVVWQMEVDKSLEIEKQFQYVKECKSDLNYRLNAQQGCLLLFLQPTDCLHLEDYLEKNRKVLTKHLITLNSSRKSDDGNTSFSDVRRSIEDLINDGIRYSSLFPDLDGYAFEANCIMKGVLWE